MDREPDAAAGEHAADPGAVDARLALGPAYLALGQYARAEIEFQTVLTLDASLDYRLRYYDEDENE